MERPLPEVEGVRHRHVEVRGFRMHVAEAGPEDGEVVLMLHGWPQHWWEWRYLMPALAGRYRVIAPDLRGLGWSEAPGWGYDKESLAKDVLALVDSLGIEELDLVGHDWGGWTGFLICLWRPQLVRRYLAMGIVPPFLPPDPKAALSIWRLAYQAVFASPLAGRGAAAWLGSLGTRGAWVGQDAWNGEQAEVFLSQFREPARQRATQLIYRTSLLLDIPRAASGRYRSMRLKTPTRLLFGLEEVVMRPEQLEGHEENADDLRVELLPGIGHFVADQAPGLVEQRALEFFD